MTARTKIVEALAVKLKLIDGTAPFTTNLYSGNVATKLKFWDEVTDFPYVCAVPGTEHREYLPGGFKWGILNVALKLYVYGEDSLSRLEDLISDVEQIIYTNENVEYETGKFTTEILINSIMTDEGLLAPYGVGEINLSVRYEI